MFTHKPRGLRGVAVLALLRSSHSHICLGNGYSVVKVHSEVSFLFVPLRDSLFYVKN